MLYFLSIADHRVAKGFGKRIHPMSLTELSIAEIRSLKQEAEVGARILQLSPFIPQCVYLQEALWCFFASLNLRRRFRLPGKSAHSIFNTEQSRSNSCWEQLVLHVPDS